MKNWPFNKVIAKYRWLLAQVPLYFQKQKRDEYGNNVLQ